MEGPWRTLEGPPGTHTMSKIGPTPCPSLDPHHVQVWTHTVSKFGPTPCPSLDPHRVQVWTHTGSKVIPTTCPRLDLPHFLVPGTASYPGPRYCLIPWSQVLPHTLIPSTAQVLPHFLVPGGPYVGSKKSKFQNGSIWAPMDFRVHMDPKWVHMEAEGRPNGGLGTKPPEKGPLGPIENPGCSPHGGAIGMFYTFQEIMPAAERDS